MNHLVVKLMIVSTALCGCASSTRQADEIIYHVNAKVIQVQPAPEICRAKSARGDGSTLLGAFVGGAVGNQFGSGNGRKAATVVGALLGAGAGAKSQNIRSSNGKLVCTKNGWVATVMYEHPISGQYVTGHFPLEKRTRATFIQIPVAVPLLTVAS
jgi:outer membrane lipoprotein SlyB